MEQSAEPGAPPVEGDGREAHEIGRRATRSGGIGSMLEFYDFFIYTQASALVFPSVFFPSDDPALAIIASLGTFGVGYLARPVGAFVLGALADRVGRRIPAWQRYAQNLVVFFFWGFLADWVARRHTLILTMALMGVSTVALGVLPGYRQIGVMAPVILVTCRLVQGFAVAGEISGSSTMIMEQTPIGLRGRRAAVTLQGAQLGQIVAAMIFIPLAALLPHDSFFSWGWRIPFLLSALVTIVGFRIRLATVESKPPQKEAVPPIRKVFRETPATVLRIFVMSLTNIIPVTATVFGASLATQKAYGIEWPPEVFLWIPVLGNLAAVAVIPVAATLSDRIGRRPMIIGGALSSGVLSFGYLWAVTHANLWLTILIGLAMWGVLYQGYNAVFPSYFPELLPASTRVTGMAIGQNIGTAASSLMAMVFAGLCPPGTRGSTIVIVVGAITLAVTCAVAVAAWASPETHRLRADDLGVPGAAPLPPEEYAAMRSAAITAAAAYSRRPPSR